MEAKTGADEHRSGAVLLLVIAAIVIAGVALSSLASQSVRRVRQVEQAEASLRSRWAERSVERMLLGQAEGLFARRDELANAGLPIVGPRHQVRLRLPLGEQVFDVVLADEDAKANLNLIYHAGGVEAVDQALQTLVGPDARLLSRIVPLSPPGSLLPPPPTDESEEAAIAAPPPAFTSWGDVLNLRPLLAGTGSGRQLVTLTGRLTLHGRGQLNITRADDDTLLAVLQSTLPEGQARLLAERLRENAAVDIGLVIDKTTKSPDQRQRLRRLLGTVSTTASIWIESTGGSARSLSCTIAAEDIDGAIRTYRFRL